MNNWIKVDHAMPFNPKILDAGPEAAWEHIGGICWSAMNTTDGHIPIQAVAYLTGNPDPAQARASLVRAGLWVPCADGFRIHDYLQYQESKALIEGRREANRLRQAEARERTAARAAAKEAKRNGSR